MARVVKSVAPGYLEKVQFEVVITKELAGAKRAMELGKMLGRPIPVPSIFINGQLAYDTTPSQEELRLCLENLTDVRA